MAAGNDFYGILGVPETATPEEIKKAYRRLARKYHPDRNPGDASAEERFRAVQEAYDVLADAEQRRRYDRARKNPFGAEFGGDFETRTGGRFYRSPDGTYVRYEQGGGQGDEGPFGGFGDLFSRMFGGEPEPAPRRADEREIDVMLTFDQMLAGGKAPVALPDGRRVRIPYPRGVKDGYRVRLRDRSPGPATTVRFRVGPHPDFRRDGLDLRTVIRVNAFEALLGTGRSLTTPYGRTLRVTVPKGAQPGDRLRLRSQGIQSDEGTGDLIVELQVTVPRDLEDRDEEAIREAAKKAGLI